MKTRFFTTTTTVASTTLAAVLGFTGLSGQLLAQDTVREFVSHKAFLEQTKNANMNNMVHQGVRVKDAAAFNEMRQHVLKMYQGAQAAHSFVKDGDHIDCIRIDQQPAVQMLGLKEIAEAPPQSLLDAQNQASGDAALPSVPADQLPAAANDEFGNSTTCEAATVPIRRVTLEEMSKFPTLKEFFQKKPADAQAKGASSAGSAAAESNRIDTAPAVSSHRYSYTYQNVNNLGGNSSLNLWSPYVNTGLGEVFSLSQQWYVGGNGGGLQTAEVGWQNFPAKYGSETSRLFIYYTADNYNNTGCYNLDCGRFVQTAAFGTLGGGFSHYSTPGGAQYDFSAQFYLYYGNWWLAINGQWIGYYPGSVYNGGQLTRFAQTIEYGTESVGTIGWYPGEGSGYWSYNGFGWASYQRNVYYINTSASSVWASLTAVDPSPRCYSITGPYFSSSSGWGIYFYEGGPGGYGC